MSDSKDAWGSKDLIKAPPAAGTSLSKADRAANGSKEALWARMLGHAPQKKALRGVTGVSDSPTLYDPDVRTWTRDDSGQIVPQICWAGLAMPLRLANLSFLIAGVPGTGKTMSIRLLLESILNANTRVYLGGHDRAILYDPKQEWYPLLSGMGVPTEQIVMLNPFDTRSDWWDLARDYTNPAEAVQLAATLIPISENHNNPFFPKAAAGLVTAIVARLIKTKPCQWDLADVLKACMSDKDAMKALDGDSSAFAASATNYLRDPRTSMNVLAELQSHVFTLLPVAACWRRAKEAKRAGFSIREFLSGDQIAILGANQAFEKALRPINQLFLRRCSELLLDNPADGAWDAGNRTWFVLDELRELGKVEGLDRLIIKGRSKGACCVLGFQDMPDLSEAFGKGAAHAITALCKHKIFLRLGGETAKWASESIGKVEVLDTNVSTSTTSSFSTGSSQGANNSTTFGPLQVRSDSYGTQQGTSSNFSTGSGRSLTMSRRETQAILDSEILHLPVWAEAFDREGGLVGFVCTSSDGESLAGVHKIKIPASAFLMHHPSGEAGFIPRADSDHEL